MGAIGREAGYINSKDSYLIITIKGKSYSAHRLAWPYMTGEHPKLFIDHKDGNKNNNKFENLREATSQENNRNRGLRSDNSTGYIGVQKTKNNTFSAVVKCNGKSKHLGTYKTPEEASEVREKYVKNFYGKFYKEGILEK